ncbi:MAG: hypothetical protein P4L35_14035 [Ignavibacteriaceae bacterium]|nr:hypothetical protein [Ignavibacteriaceae bacterium]
MKNKNARFTFLGICLVLAILLLTQVITIIVSAIIFAICLVVVGLIPKFAP